MKTYLYYILSIFLLCSLCSRAQESAKEKEVLPAKLSIIAIGPKPSRSFGDSGALLPAKRGEIPPRRLHFEAKEDAKAVAKKEDEDKDGDKAVLSSINVTFNNPSHFIEVPPGRTLALQRREESEYSDYITLKPLEPGSMTLVLLRPSGKGDKRWVPEPYKSIIDLQGSALRNKKLAILNLSRRAVKSIFHDDKKMIPAGGFQAYDSIEGLELHRMAAAYGREDRIIFNTALRLNKSNRLLFYVLYDANPNTNDGRTVGLFRTSVEPEVGKESVPVEDSEE